MTSTNAFSIKVTHVDTGDIRRATIETTNYAELQAKLATLLAAPGPFALSYLDDESDRIALSSNEELKEAVRLAAGGVVRLWATAQFLTKETNPCEVVFSADSPMHFPDDITSQPIQETKEEARLRKREAKAAEREAKAAAREAKAAERQHRRETKWVGFVEGATGCAAAVCDEARRVAKDAKREAKLAKQIAKDEKKLAKQAAKEAKAAVVGFVDDATECASECAVAVCDEAERVAKEAKLGARDEKKKAKQAAKDAQRAVKQANRTARKEARKCAKASMGVLAQLTTLLDGPTSSSESEDGNENEVTLCDEGDAIVVKFHLNANEEDEEDKAVDAPSSPDVPTMALTDVLGKLDTVAPSPLGDTPMSQAHVTFNLGTEGDVKVDVDVTTEDKEEDKDVDATTPTVTGAPVANPFLSAAQQDSTAVSSLVAMGFDVVAARHALATSNGDMEAAINTLLEA